MSLSSEITSRQTMNHSGRRAGPLLCKGGPAGIVVHANTRGLTRSVFAVRPFMHLRASDRDPESREHKPNSASKDTITRRDGRPGALQTHLEDTHSQSVRFFSGQISQYTQTLLAEIERVAQRPFNILITGETGTGKT